MCLYIFDKNWTHMLLNARTHLQFLTAWKNYEVLSYFHIYQKAIKWLGDIDKRENLSLNWKVLDRKCGLDLLKL